jgi:hypothetical protein
LLIAAALLPALAGCKEPPNPLTTPLSYWLDHEDGCVRMTARAILDSGRPWPNERRDAGGNVVTFDLWVGNQLYELPAKPGGPFVFGIGAKYHPLKYGISGHAETVIGVPPERMMKFKHPGVGSTLYGNVRCYAHLPREQWVESRWPNAASREALIEDITNRSRDPKRVASVERREREDIGMTEIASIPIDPITKRFIGASYVPINRDLVQVIEGKKVFKSIGCSGTHDRDLPLGTADRCDVWVYLGPGLWVEFSVYQQALALLPELHDQMVAMFEKHRIK